LVYCSKMETKLFSQVLSFGISMCVQYIPKLSSTDYLTRTMLFSCRYVIRGEWHKHFSTYRMAQKSINTPLDTCDLKCQATLAAPAYLFQ
jgi:hypothetical protein